MKKIIIILAMLFGLSINMESNVVTISDKLNVENVSTYLNIKKDYNFDKEISLNDDSLVNISFDDFCRSMKICNNIGNEQMRKSIFYSGITKILDDYKIFLNRDRYRQFLINFNLMMYKHGFLEESSEYCDCYRK